MSDTFDDVYMGTALLHAKKSKAVRAKVGAVLVTKTGIIIPGYNGTPSGTDNACEDQVREEDGIVLVTKPEVLHAELNTIMKAAREGVSVLGSTVYVTLSPCLPCSAMLLQAGISRLIYKDKYRDNSGVEYLQKYGIECRQM
jgi:dCMP deaminase